MNSTFKISLVRTISLGILVLALLVGIVLPAKADANEVVCGQPTHVRLNGAYGAYTTTDPEYQGVVQTVTTPKGIYTVSTRTLIETRGNIDLAFSDNTFTCTLDNALSQQQKIRLLEPMVPDEYWFIDAQGNVSKEVYPNPVGTWTPEPPTATPTFTFTATSVPPTETPDATATSVSPTATLSATATQQPASFTVWLPVVQSGEQQTVVEPTPSATATAIATEMPYDEGDCGNTSLQRIIAGQWTFGWTSTDAQILHLKGGDHQLKGRALVISESSYGMSQTFHTWSCFAKGTMPVSYRESLLKPMYPAWLVLVDSAGKVTSEILMDATGPVTNPTFVQLQQALKPAVLPNR